MLWVQHGALITKKSAYARAKEQALFCCARLFTCIFTSSSEGQDNSSQAHHEHLAMCSGLMHHHDNLGAVYLVKSEETFRPEMSLQLIADVSSAQHRAMVDKILVAPLA